MHRGESLKHFAFAALTLGLHGLFGARTLHKLGELVLLDADLLAQSARRGADGGEFGRQGCPHLGFLRADFGQNHRVPRFQHDGVGVDRIGAAQLFGPAGAANEHADHRAERNSDDEANEQGDDGIHGPSVPVAADNESRVR